MGYYSDVAIKCGEGIAKEILHVVKSTGVIAPEVTYDIMRDGSREYTIVWNSIKWYKSFPEIRLIENVLYNRDDEDGAEYGYRFVRIGEEYDDIEERCNNYDIDLYILRDFDGLCTKHIDIDEVLSNASCDLDCASETGDLHDLF